MLICIYCSVSAGQADNSNYIEDDDDQLQQLMLLPSPEFVTLGQKYNVAMGSTVVLPCKINESGKVMPNVFIARFPLYVSVVVFVTGEPCGRNFNVEWAVYAHSVQNVIGLQRWAKVDGISNEFSRSPVSNVYIQYIPSVLNYIVACDFEDEKDFKLH